MRDTVSKSKIFTKQKFVSFLRQVDDFKYLPMKVILIIGISGACRCDEMIKMTVDDIEDLGSLLHVKLPHTKINKSRSFTVVGDVCDRL